MKCALLTLLFSAATFVGEAQNREAGFLLRENDTLRYTYTPLHELPAAAPADTVRPGFFRRLIDYFGRAAEDRSREKRIDITFAGGPSYSKTTKLGLGLLAAGLYRFDRQDTVTPPSDISIFANVSTSGFYAFGLTGNTIFPGDRNRLIYDVSFTSSPRDLWGIGYEAGRHNPPTDFVEQRSRIAARYLHRLFQNTYAGFIFHFDHTNGRDLDETGFAYLHDEHRHYTATGFGAMIEYDTRDFIPNPARGVYLSLRETWFPKGLGSCPKAIFRTVFIADLYRHLWRGGLLAFDFYGEFNSDDTPWPLLARMGGNERMRGYYEGRYTDNCLITCQLELRQHIWRRIGCVVWAGAGNVFSQLDEYRWSQTLPNYGAGLRWELKKRVNVRMDYGFGRNTSGFLLSINEAF